MVSVLASRAVDRGFQPRSGQTKDYEIDICYTPTRRVVDILEKMCERTYGQTKHEKGYNSRKNQPSVKSV
jgi:hypothetical protein